MRVFVFTSSSPFLPYFFTLRGSGDKKKQKNTTSVVSTKVNIRRLSITPSPPPPHFATHDAVRLPSMLFFLFFFDPLPFPLPYLSLLGYPSSPFLIYLSLFFPIRRLGANRVVVSGKGGGEGRAESTKLWLRLACPWLFSFPPLPSSSNIEPN